MRIEKKKNEFSGAPPCVWICETRRVVFCCVSLHVQCSHILIWLQSIFYFRTRIHEDEWAAGQCLSLFITKKWLWTHLNRMTGSKILQIVMLYCSIFQCYYKVCTKYKIQSNKHNFVNSELNIWWSKQPNYFATTNTLLYRIYKCIILSSL